MSHLPRVPVRFLPQNQELVKAQEGIAGQRSTTDYSQELSLATVSRAENHERMPLERANGNPIFRRYMNGELDVEYAKDRIVTVMHKVKDGGGTDILNNQEKTVLGVLFPAQFDYVDPALAGAIAMSQFRLSMGEIASVRMAVAAHLAEELNWNAGQGGNSVPGRSTTRS